VAFRLSRDARLVRFRSTDGLSLEGRLTRADPGRVVALCHPHPLYGGSMLTPVILTVEQAFQEAGFTTLAFNFRGVGASEGSHGRGDAEAADVAGALGFLADEVEAPPSMVALAGYSFGSAVGGRVAATDPRVRLFLGVAPPLNHYDFGFLREARCRIALVAGTRDEHADVAALRALAASLPEAPWVRLLDTDHFFTGALDRLKSTCLEAVAQAG
jgi:alpha/beta superfamily hydrolase